MVKFSIKPELPEGNIRTTFKDLYAHIPYEPERWRKGENLLLFNEY
ncbi:hypothetical protein [Desulfosporosinus burensis]